GDGRADIVPVNGKYLGATSTYLSAAGAIPDLVTSVTGPLGGVTTIAYQPSSGVRHGPMPGIVQEVKTLTTSDGRTTPSTTTFAYAGGLFNAAERRFLGFRTVTADLPCNAGDAACPRKISTFRQDLASAGRLEKLEETTTATSAPVLRRSLETWSVKTTAGLKANWPPATGTVPALTLPYTAFDTASEAQQIFGSITRRSTLARQFDDYGNITKLTENGDADQTGDERLTLTSYAYNTGDYIVSAPYRTRIYAGTTSSDPLMEDTLLHYDGAASYTTPPTKGDVTQIRRWLDTSSSWIVAGKAEYDAYGNKTAVVDALGNRSETIYDTTYRLFPVEVRNAKYVQDGDTRQTATSTYDAQCQKPLTVTDMNGGVTSFTYDALCRLTRKDLPLIAGDSKSAFVKVDYVALGSPTSQYVDVRTPGPTGTVEIYTKTYLDGLGRTWRTLAQGPSTSQVITALTDYTARGTVARASRPFYSGDTAYYTATAYDALDRLVKVTNPDGSTATQAYGTSDLTALRGFLTVTATDELGRQGVTHADAYGRAVRQTRFLDAAGTAPVSRTMTYDALGQLVGLTDPAGNQWANTFDLLGRRTKIQDPDLGTWTFAYDVAGQLTLQTDAKAQQIAFTYDRLGRILTKTVGSDVSTYTYDEARTGFFNVGVLTTAANAVASLTSDRDKLGREVKKTLTVDGQSYQTTTAYDIGSRILWRLLPDGSTIGSASAPMLYDPAGRLVGVPGLVAGITYDASGKPLVTTYANAGGNTVLSTATYDAVRGWLTGLRHEQSGG
ncbi:toxin TcdB middle/N-terminal domain-containing protein, partial [Labrys wisconsinensis]